MRTVPKKKAKVEPSEAPSWTAVYDGRQCLGHVLSRGKLGTEAFNTDDESLGVFPNLKTAVNATKVAS